MAGHLARAGGIHGARQRAKTGNLGYDSAERGDALGAEHARAVRRREAQQRRVQVGVALELDQHVLGELVRHLLEQRVLAREVVIHGLLGDAGTARDLVDARLVAVAHERFGGGAQHARAVLCGHSPPLE
jgi:hypothetical protein